MKIVVDEEYGFKYWLWTIDSNESGVKAYFNEIVGEKNFYSKNLPDQFLGQWKELSWEKYRSFVDKYNFDAAAHIHTDEDSSINFNVDTIDEIVVGSQEWCDRESWETERQMKAADDAGAFDNPPYGA